MSVYPIILASRHELVAVAQFLLGCSQDNPPAVFELSLSGHRVGIWTLHHEETDGGSSGAGAFNLGARISQGGATCAAASDPRKARGARSKDAMEGRKEGLQTDEGRRPRSKKSRAGRAKGSTSGGARRS